MIPILFYVIIYKMFRILVSDTLNSLQKVAKVKNVDAKRLIDSTAKIVGFFFLVSYSILYLTSVTVYEGVLYRYVLSFMNVAGFLVCAFAAFRWRSYIAPAAEVTLPKKYSKFLAPKCLSWW